MSLERDAETFIAEAREADFAGMDKREVQRWMFRVKKQMTARYETSIEGFETDYEASLTSEEGGHAEFVVDRRGSDVEVNAFVVVDGEGVVNEVWTQD